MDNQIRANYQKAKVRRRLTPLKRLAALVLVLLVAGGAWMLMKDWDMLTFKRTAVNSKPVAEFTASSIQVFEGEKVIFTNESTDPDEGDSIKSVLWNISKAGTSIFKSKLQGIAYTFVDPGEFEVTLVVADTHGAVSEPAKILVEVLPKLDLPPPDTDSEDNEK
ncbi:MAG TPA: PKD domain-containing protein [Bacillota bacterium]|nr:PKD domain-containing protein [Bacillota bacterium]